MEVVGCIILGIIIFTILGIGGWLLEIVKYVFEFLLDGFFKSLGCLFWVIVIILIIMNL